MIRSFCALCLALLLAVYLGAGTKTLTLSADNVPTPGKGAVTLTVTTTSTGTVTWSYSINGGTVDIRRVLGDGSNTTEGGDVLLTRTLSGSATVSGESTTRTVGKWLRLYVANNTSNDTKWLQVGGELDQTVSITPTSASLLSGEAVTFTASGGQNGYQWSISNGGGLVSSGANAAYTAGAPGTYLVKVWSNAGNGYARSDDATAIVAVSESFRKQINLPANDGARPVKYLVFQNGEVVAEYTQNPGDGARITTIVVPTADPLTVMSQVQGVVQNPETGSWEVVPGGSSTPTVSEPIIPEPSHIPSTTPPVEIPKENVPNTDPTKGKQTNKIVWPGGGVNNDPQNQTDLLTNATFRTGVEKLAENTDAILTELQEAKEREEKNTEDIKDSADQQAASMQAELQGGLIAGQAFSDVIKQGREVSSATVTPPAPSGSLWEVNDKNLGVISLNPFDSPRVKQGFRSLVGWVRALVGWGIVLGLTAYVYSEMRKAMVALMTIPQQKFVVEQVVQGSMWTTLTTWAARAVVRATFVAFLIALPTACIQIFSTEWSQLALTFAASVETGSAAGGGADGGAGVADFLALVNCVIPVATVMSAGATYAAVEFGLINLQSIWMVFFRLSK